MYKKTQHIHFVGIGGIGMSGIGELLLNLGFQFHRRSMRRDHQDLAIQAGGELGNYYTGANVGAVYRVGFGLPDTYSAANLRTGGASRRRPRPTSRSRAADVSGSSTARTAGWSWQPSSRSSSAWRGRPPWDTVAGPCWSPCWRH